MYETFTQERITQLRMKKDVSAREMSLSLGQKQQLYQSYRKQESVAFSGNAVFVFATILVLRLGNFFDEGNAAPRELNDIIEDLKSLDAETFGHVAAPCQCFKKKSP